MNYDHAQLVTYDAIGCTKLKCPSNKWYIDISAEKWMRALGYAWTESLAVTTDEDDFLNVFARDRNAELKIE